MFTKEDMLNAVEKAKQTPIYEICLFENTGEPKVDDPKTQTAVTVDLGDMDVAGLFFDLDDAIKCMHENTNDLHGPGYEAGVIVCKFQGLEDGYRRHERIYFKWDPAYGGYTEAEEPRAVAILEF